MANQPKNKRSTNDLTKHDRLSLESKKFLYSQTIINDDYDTEWWQNTPTNHTYVYNAKINIYRYVQIKLKWPLSSVVHSDRLVMIMMMVGCSAQAEANWIFFLLFISRLPGEKNNKNQFKLLLFSFYILIVLLPEARNK